MRGDGGVESFHVICRALFAKEGVTNINDMNILQTFTLVRVVKDVHVVGGRV